MPFVVADEGIVLLSFFTPSNAAVEEDRSATAAIMQFHIPLMHLLGPPNDEAIKGHPLWRRGLDYYSAYRVEHSSLLRRIAIMNYVHPRNDPAAFDKFHHYILTFEDSTFECVAQSYSSAVERVISDDERYQRTLGILHARNEAWRSGDQIAADTKTLTARFRRWRNMLNRLPR
jgi:hypothetical protein